VPREFFNGLLGEYPGGVTAQPPSRLTQLLTDLDRGGEHAGAELLPLVYEELRALARARMRHEPPGHTLQATSLVHEAYLRLIGSDAEWKGRAHFFGAAALAMRRILVEAARRKRRARHGGEVERVELDDAELAIEPPQGDLLELEAALQRLEAQDPRKGRIVNLRLFAGLTNEETAQLLEVSVGTVEREWRFVRAWLRTELGEDRGPALGAGSGPAA